MRRNVRKGESFVEYTLMIPILIAGFFGVSHYVKRALEGRLGGALATGRRTVIGVAGAQVYVPGLTEAELTTTVVGRQIDVFKRSELDANVDITNITSASDQETTVSGRKRVDEQPFWRLYD